MSKTNNASQVQVRFFASLREAAGLNALHHELTAPATTAELRQQLATRPELAKADLLAKDLLVAVNQRLTDWNAEVQPGDEVAFFPPVTGG